MNWNAVEAISSAIGAIGVIVTVVYLAFQIRQNTHSIQGVTEQSLMNLEKEVFTLIADNAGVYRRGRENVESFDEDEKVQFRFIVAADMSLVYSAYFQFNRKLISHEVWNAYLVGSRNNLVKSGYAATWNNLKADYPASFRNEIKLVENGGADAA